MPTDSSDTATLSARLHVVLNALSVRFGEFTLASGRTSDFYVDARQTTLNSEGSNVVAHLMLDRIQPDITAIGGPTMGADPIVSATTATAWATDRELHGFLVRKEAKSHGAGRQIEGLGSIPQGSKVCVVEDTTTTGGSLLKALGAIEAAGLVVAQCITVVDREEGAVERLAEAGYTLEALTTRSSLEKARTD